MVRVGNRFEGNVNAECVFDHERKAFVVKALMDIKAGVELLYEDP
jgi:hypothetical protein